MNNHERLQKWLDDSAELVELYDGIGTAAVKECLDEEKRDYQQKLCEQFKAGTITELELKAVYKRHGWLLAEE